MGHAMNNYTCLLVIYWALYSAIWRAQKEQSGSTQYQMGKAASCLFRTSLNGERNRGMAEKYKLEEFLWNVQMRHVHGSFCIFLIQFFTFPGHLQAVNVRKNWKLLHYHFPGLPSLEPEYFGGNSAAAKSRKNWMMSHALDMDEPLGGTFQVSVSLTDKKVRFFNFSKKFHDILDSPVHWLLKKIRVTLLTRMKLINTKMT